MIVVQCCATFVPEGPHFCSLFSRPPRLYGLHCCSLHTFHSFWRYSNVSHAVLAPTAMQFSHLPFFKNTALHDMAFPTHGNAVASHWCSLVTSLPVPPFYIAPEAMVPTHPLPSGDRHLFTASSGWCPPASRKPWLSPTTTVKPWLLSICPWRSHYFKPAESAHPQQRGGHHPPTYCIT